MERSLFLTWLLWITLVSNGRERGSGEEELLEVMDEAVNTERAGWLIALPARTQSLHFLDFAFALPWVAEKQEAGRI